MVNFLYQFARVPLHFLWRSTIDWLLIPLSGIVIPIFVWTRSEATTALRVFQIWYCGGDLCLSTGAESSALVKIFCILHGWGRVFAKPDLFLYYLYRFLSLLVWENLISFTKTHGGFCLCPKPKFLPSCILWAHITVSASEMHLPATLIIQGTMHVKAVIWQEQVCEHCE
jgi:hypothetical protein